MKPQSNQLISLILGLGCLSIGIYVGIILERYQQQLGLDGKSWYFSLITSFSSFGQHPATAFIDTYQSAFNRHRKLVNMPPPSSDYTDYSHLVKSILGTSKRSSPKDILKIISPEFKAPNPTNNHTNEFALAIEKVLGSEITSFQASTFLSNPLTKAISTPVDHAINSNSPRLNWIHHDDREISDLFDIVILTGNGSANYNTNGHHVNNENKKWLSFLQSWKFMLSGLHVIIIQQGDPYRKIDMPTWLEYDLFNKHDVEKTLGEYSWIIDMESDTSSAKSFGYMVADRDFVFFLDRNVVPALDLEDGQPINPLEEHLLNLLTPSAPYYFNTHFDPYRAGSDFSRGYPHSLREGYVTAVSHGYVLNSPNYDATTRFMKPLEAETRRPDVVMTIPNSLLYSMSSSNVAINRNVAGPTMLFPGFLRSINFDIGDQNIDVLVGWINKVVMDNVLAGVKFGGRGYVSNNFNTEAKPHIELAQDLTWANQQEEIVRFFNAITLSPKNKDSAVGSMDELSGKIEIVLGKINPSFIQLAKAMRLFSHIWNKQHAFHPELLAVASRSSNAPPPSSEHKCVAFTIMHDEQVMLPLWIRYYNRHLPDAIYVVQHMMNTTSHPNMASTIINSTSRSFRNQTHIDGTIVNRDVNAIPDFHRIAPGINVTHYKLRGDPYGYPVHFLASIASLYQMRFFRSGYKCVLYTDVDEFIAPDPKKYPGGLTEYLNKFSKDPKQLHHRAVGYTVAHVSESEDAKPPLEKPMDWQQPILQQRGYWNRYPKYDKPLLSKIPVRWKPGFHNTFLPAIGHDTDLYLLHFTEVDSVFCGAKELHKYEMIKLAHPDETAGGFNHHIAQYPQLLAKGVICRYARAVYMTAQNRVVDRTGTIGLEKMDDSWRNVTI